MNESWRALFLGETWKPKRAYSFIEILQIERKAERDFASYCEQEEKTRKDLQELASASIETSAQGDIR